jgi:hypothetical protein
MVPTNETGEPDTIDPPFTIASPEGLLIAVPIGIVMLVAGGALRLNITSFKKFLAICVVAGFVSGAALTRRKTFEKLGANQRTVLELLMLLGMASAVCRLLLKIFLEGRAG